MSSNSFQGSGPDIASLLAMIQGGGPPNSGGQQHQNQPQNSAGTNSVGNYVQNGTNGGTDPSIMSSLLQGILSLGQQQQQQQQRNPRNGLNDVLSLLSAQAGSGGQGVDLSRLAASGLLGSLQGGGGGSGSDYQSSQPQNLSSYLKSQGNQSSPTQEQALALALARMAGARLLSGDDASSSDANGGAKANTSRQTRSVESDNSSPFFAHRKNIISDTASESTRGRNLEPGAVAVPCRARGMPMDHNPLTAYFVINNGVQHGEDVVCSHPACRNAGVKFRYCSFCKAPVAKRNFRRRHNHGGETSTSSSDDLDDESAKMSTVSATSSRRLISASEEEPEAKRAKLVISSEDDDVATTTDSSKSSTENGRNSSSSSDEPNSSSSSDEPKHTEPSKRTEKAEVAKPAPKHDAPIAAGEADSSTATIKASGKSISLERREQWAKLLEERPITNDSESMSAWIDKILKVSDAGEEGKLLSEAMRQLNNQKK